MIAELLYSGLDLIVAAFIALLYYLEVPLVQQYIWEILLATFAVRYAVGTDSLTQTC